MKRFLTLAKIELKLSLRSFDAVFFGIMMPLIIIAIITIVDKAESGAGMIEHNFGAYISIGICAVGLMGMPLVLADYRYNKILKKLKATPSSPGLLLSVQLTVQLIMAGVSAIITAIAASLIMKKFPEGSFLVILLSYLLVLIAIFSIGLVIASLAPDIKKAGFICNLVYFPMLLFSGTTIPFSVFPKTMQDITSALPLTQGIKLLNGVSAGQHVSGFIPSIIILAGIAATGIIISIKFFRWDMKS